MSYVVGAVVEQVMFFALGFLIAGLLTLLFLPILRRRAIRLATRRLEMQMPLTMAEIVAERDQVRAEAAVSQRQIEQRGEVIATAHAAGMAEIGRQAVVLAERDADLAAMTTKADDLAVGLARSEGEHADVAAQLGALHQAHWGASAQIETLRKILSGLENERDELRQALDESRIAAATIETQVTSVFAQLAGTETSLRQVRTTATEHERARYKLADEAGALRAEVQAAKIRRDHLEATLETARLDGAARQEALHAEQRAHTRLETQLNDKIKLLTDADEREIAQRRAHDGEIEALREEGRTVARRLEKLIVENADLEGALTAARRGSSRTPPASLHPDRPAIVPEPESHADDLALLRRSISAVGAEVIKLAAALDEKAANTAAADPPLPASDARGSPGRAKTTRKRRFKPPRSPNRAPAIDA